MSAAAMSKEQLLREFAAAYERLIEAALACQVAQGGAPGRADTWGPREVVAHLAGWEVMATVRIPKIVAGMTPPEFADPMQARVMNDAINATIVTMVGAQSLETLCGMLRQAYQRTSAILEQVDESFFQPGKYVYERTLAVIDHCHEHLEVHLSQDA